MVENVRVLRNSRQEQEAVRIVDLDWGLSAAQRLLEQRSGGLDPDLRAVFTVALAALNTARDLDNRVASLEAELAALTKTVNA